MPSYRPTTTAVDGAMHFKMGLNDYADRGLLGALAREAGMVLPSLDVVSDLPILAFLHWDRWVTSCVGSDDQPHGADVQFVWTSMPLFMCSVCFNKTAGYAWRPVVLPDLEERTEIEAIVGLRRDYRDRSWIPGQTASDLRQQNIEHGDAIPTLGAAR